MTISRNLFLAALVTVAFPVVAGDDAATTTTTTTESTGFGTKVYNVVSWPFVTTAALALGTVDTVASYSGALRLAKYLASSAEGAEKGYIAAFFTGKEQNTARLIAVLGTAAAVVGLQKAYEKFAEQEYADADEYNFNLTEEDFDAEDAQ